VTSNTKKLARLQTAFAVAGLILGSATFLTRSQAPGAWLGYTFTGVFLGFTLYASKRMLAGDRSGIRLSLIVQLLQVIHIQIQGLYWFFLVGPLVEIGGSSAIVAIRFGLGAVASIFPLDPNTAEMPGTYASFGEGWRLDPTAEDLRIKIGLNIVALVMVLGLVRALAASAPVPTQVTTDSAPAA
jgi:hypothetical protein